MQPKTPLFTSDNQHPPRFGHAVYLGDVVYMYVDTQAGLRLCYSCVAKSDFLEMRPIYAP